MKNIQKEREESIKVTEGNKEIKKKNKKINKIVRGLMLVHRALTCRKIFPFPPKDGTICE